MREYVRLRSVLNPPHHELLARAFGRVFAALALLLLRLRRPTASRARAQAVVCRAIGWRIETWSASAEDGRASRRRRLVRVSTGGGTARIITRRTDHRPSSKVGLFVREDEGEVEGPINMDRGLYT